MKLAPWVDAHRLEAGCDEAGRGCLAGPVTAAAVILPNEVARVLVKEGVLNDSKKLSKSVRNQLRRVIEKEAFAWCVVHVEPAVIDRINILQASLEAMRRAVRGLTERPDFILIDGNRFTSADDLPPHACYVKGDGRFASIAAASILAKTHRDELMTELHGRYPEYGWNANAGYPTAAHRAAIRECGLSPHHRASFRQLPEQLPLFD